MRNFNEYEGKDITEERWKMIELRMELCISAINKVITNNLK